MTAPHLLLALEDLARDRREMTTAILTIARVAGVDAEPYLAYDRNLTPAIDLPTPAPSKEPPRPSRPASPATNGTGRAHRVETNGAGDLEAKVRLALRDGARSPKELVDLTGTTRDKLFGLLRAMLDAGTLTKSGQMRSVKYELA